MHELGQTADGRAEIRSAMRLCDTADLYSADNMTSFRDWVAGAWDSMAMGNYPYTSGWVFLCLLGVGECVSSCVAMLHTSNALALAGTF